MPTPSDPESGPLADFIGLRDSLRVNRIGHGGREVCAALTESLDRAIAGLVSTERGDLAVVALGGYGRGELSPFSDVDLMLLHAVEDAAEPAADLFRPLWDAKLRVGHSVRTVAEAAGAARERFDTQTTLLTGRLVAGSNDLYDRLMGDVARVTRARPLRRHLVSDERQRRQETPFPLMAVDVKTGRGGLRTLQAFEWERRREALIGRFTSDRRPEEESAAEILLRVRNGLHVVAGRAHDVFSPELREPVARWLGVGVFDLAGDLVAAMHGIDGLAARRWPEVLEPQTGPAGRKLWSRANRRADALRTDGPPDRAQLDRMLASGEAGRVAFERLWDDGLLAEILPEWGVVADLPQLEPFHEHPVAPHLWRTVGEMQRLIDGERPFGDIADRLGQPEVLRLSAFLHDIGKGHGGDHATVGAGIARSFCARMGYDAATSELVTGAVLHHLLLPLTATRRDLDDPAVIEEVATVIGSVRLLQTLYLLTVADSRATGPSMWNDWKATLLRTLYSRCETRLGDAGLDVGTTREAVISAAGPLAGAAAEHIDAMPEEYLRSVTADEVLWHLELISGLEGASNMGVRPGQPFETVVVVGRERPGFRRIVAAALAANGIDVLEARLLGRADGMVVDTYRVRDDRTGGAVPATRWGPIGSDVESGLLGELDTGSKLATRAAAYPASSLTGPGPSATTSHDAATGDLVVVVKCSDRIGRLVEILGALSECGLEIRLAKLDSREGELVDTFHVAAESPIEESDLAGLDRRIAGAIPP